MVSRGGWHRNLGWSRSGVGGDQNGSRHRSAGSHLKLIVELVLCRRHAARTVVAKLLLPHLVPIN